MKKSLSANDRARMFAQKIAAQCMGGARWESELQRAFMAGYRNGIKDSGVLTGRNGRKSVETVGLKGEARCEASRAAFSYESFEEMKSLRGRPDRLGYSWPASNRGKYFRPPQCKKKKVL